MTGKNDGTHARQGLLTWIDDEPDHEIEIPSNQSSASPIQVLFFVDDEEEEEEATTYIATAGLCERSFEWAPGGVELMLCVLGEYEIEELLPLGQLLGHLALALRGVETAPVPGLLLEVGPLPIFEGMTCLLLTQWDIGEGGLLETTPPIRLLSVNPLYEEEAAEIVKYSEEEALAWFDEHGVDIDDPLRDSAFAKEFAAASEQTLAAFNNQSSFEIAAAMQQMSGSMASWLSAAAPGFFSQFSPPEIESQEDQENDKDKDGDRLWFRVFWVCIDTIRALFASISNPATSLFQALTCILTTDTLLPLRQ